MGQGFTNLTPGRVITHVERYYLPSGRYRELRRTTMTVQDPGGVFRTEELVEVIPPLDCSCVPESLHDVAECTACGAIVCRSRHGATCAQCGRVFCVACLKKIEVEDELVLACDTCRRKLSAHPIVKLFRRIWE